MATINLPFAASGPHRIPTMDELANGYECGPLDEKLDNWLMWWLTGQMSGAMTAAGLNPDDTDLTRLATAIFGPRSPISLAPAGGQPAILATDHNRYFERDVLTNGAYPLPSLASTPLGTRFIVKHRGNINSLPVPAVTITGGGNFKYRQNTFTTFATLGRDETLAFLRTSVGYEVEVIAHPGLVLLVATSSDANWISGPTSYGPIPTLEAVSSDAPVFNFGSGKFTAPIIGTYAISLNAQFNANGGNGGGGVLIGPSPFTSISAAADYQYADIAASFSARQSARTTNVLIPGQVIEFDYILLNAQSRIRRQDFGVSVVLIGR